MIKGFVFYCVIDILSKYAEAVLLKDKKGITITNAFQKILNESKRKPYKIWVDKGSEFYNKTMKPWYRSDIEVYSTHIEVKSLAAESFLGL